MEITLNRSRLQEAHEVLRHLSDRRSPSSLSDKILVLAEKGHVSIVATNGHTDVFHHAEAPENQAIARFLVPLTTLADLAKGREGPVQLSGEAPAQAEVEKFPVIGADGPKRFRRADRPLLLRHLRNAGEAAAAGPDRDALTSICLTQSSIVATDGRQLYAGNSLSLPIRKGHHWLAAPSKVLAAKTFAGFAQVAMATDYSGILLKFGDAWTIRLRQQQGRFPDWHKVVPELKEAKAALTLPEGKGSEFIGRIGGLVHGLGKGVSLRLSLGPKVIATALDGDLKELRSLELPDLALTGDDLTVIFDPEYLLHALKLGFLRLHFFAPNKPIIATKGSDLYLWMPCVEETIEPTTAGQPSSTEKESTPMPDNKTETAKPEPQPNDLEAIRTKLDVLRGGLRDLSTKAVSVKQAIRQRAADLQKREKAVQQALAGLKQLKNLGA